MVAGGLLLVLLVYAAMTSFYTVSAESQAVVLRFGKIIKTTDPGLHWKLPLGIDRHYTVRSGGSSSRSRLRHRRIDEPWQATELANRRRNGTS
jgi:regulator of protease activity HflC (stomatin/prohibitin superfamily)